MEPRILIISPVRNEATHIERVVRSVVAQDLQPAGWIVLDDNSTDGTRELLESLAAEVPFLEVHAVPAHTPHAGARDRLARAAAPRNFNLGLGLTDWQQYTHVMKLDGDIELAPNYLRVLMERFAAYPQLGLAGGVLIEPQPVGFRDRDSASPRPRCAQVLLDGMLRGNRRSSGAAGVGHDRRDLCPDAGLQHRQLRGSRLGAPSTVGECRRCAPGPDPARRMRLHHPLSGSVGHFALGEAQRTPTAWTAGSRVHVRLCPRLCPSHGPGRRLRLPAVYSTRAPRTANRHRDTAHNPRGCRPRSVALETSRRQSARQREALAGLRDPVSPESCAHRVVQAVSRKGSMAAPGRD